MAQPRLDFDGFLAVARRARLPVTPEQAKELYSVYHHFEAMVDRVRGGVPRPVAAEPAVIFKSGSAKP